MYSSINKLSAINGDGWSCPESTINSLWAALGAGADELTLSVFMSKDGFVICAPEARLGNYCDSDVDIAQTKLAELQELDAGYLFRSTQLDANYQATGERGDDYPWRRKPEIGKLKERRPLFFPSLKQVLELFGRRTTINLIIPETADSSLSKLSPKVLEEIGGFGLLEKITLCSSLKQLALIRSLNRSVNLRLHSHSAPNVSELEALSELSGASVLVNFDSVNDLDQVHRTELFDASASLNIGWRFFSEHCPLAPTPDILATLQSYSCRVEAWETRGTLPSRNACSARALVFEESFAGTELNRQYWSAGYSHINQETKISVKDALIISIAEGKVYSGGAAICALPLHGDFDAEVSFHVANPAQATTFELAAIGIDPGYHNIDNTALDTKKVNLTFDVHGAPPYASSERDQNDGFRCGWNNSFNFAKISDNWHAASANMYNKYGRDVGDGSNKNLYGKLRLVRCGELFNSYYQDAHNEEWVGSGSMLVQNLPQDAYLRLAAKHWHKVDPAPHNEVRFWDFKIHQY